MLSADNKLMSFRWCDHGQSPRCVALRGAVGWKCDVVTALAIVRHIVTQLVYPGEWSDVVVTGLVTV